MRVSTHCFAVTGLGYVPPWTVNAGFIAGAHATLIVDTGANAAAALTIHGYASAVRPGNRLLVVNTEKHFDHIGGNSVFRALGLDVYGHPGIARTEEEFRAEQAGFREQIVHPVRRAASEEQQFYRDTSLTNPSHSLTDGMALDLGECTAQVIFTPGHTPTNISLYVPEDRVLYCGDCLTNGYLPNLDCGGPSEWAEWLTSLDRIEALDPASVIAGHGPVASGDEVRVLIETVRQALRQTIANT